ncbi:YhgE/Pip family protein [Microbacterium deminutum]|uniref:ABC-2 type transporter transmembrane domain-containing protein n=1 Tax=Microbacterium deminutum TaxID=344164 RepID=A0ABN2R0H6_9MICO
MTANRLSLALERARTRRPVTWLTLIGVLLLPVVIGGILVAALYNPVERLDGLNAAIVNDDKPVTIKGQYVPLGRQLTAGLVKGSDSEPSNLTWTLSNADDAAKGLADGTYSAVVTIPENFSAAATSTQPGETPTQATINVQTPPDSLIVDDAITSQVTTAAASLMGDQLSKVYLENVFLGFTTLGDQLGKAADGAHKLASGAQTAADGAAALPGGATKLADGARGIASGASSLGGGLTTIAGKTRDAAAGTNQLAAGLDGAAANVKSPELVAAAAASATYAKQAADQTAALAQTSGGVAQSAQTHAQTMGGLAADCVAGGGSAAFCARVADAAAASVALAQSAGGAAQGAVAAATSAGTANGYAAPTSSGISQLTTQTSAGLTDAANQTRVLAGGLTQLAGGIDQSASGAVALSSGASQLGTGGDQLASGARSLAAGVQSIAAGTGDLAGGLHKAASSLPKYTDAEATSLADVVADPVAAKGAGTSLFGASAIPLLAMLALWFGGLATFVALQAVSRRALTSRAPSAVLALRGFAPAAALGAAQGLLVAGVVQFAASYDWASWSVFAGISIAAGIAFAAVNQALVAVFGGAGRWISALVGVLAVATGVVSTVPGVLSSVAALMPTAPAYNGMVAALTSASGVGAALAGLAIWSLLAFLATVIAVARKRTTSARELLAASPAPA